MNFKLITLGMLLIMTVGMAYTVSNYTVSTEVNMHANGGFTVTIAGETDAETELLAGHPVYVYILTEDGHPIKQICSYENETTCFLTQTDHAGKANGLFYIDNDLQFGHNYTLQIRTAGTTSTETFQVLEPRDLSYAADWTLWVKNNAGYVSIILVITLFLLISIAWLYHHIINY